MLWLIECELLLIAGSDENLWIFGCSVGPIDELFFGVVVD